MKQTLLKAGLHIPFVRLFMMIAEPRVRRLMYFGIYVGLGILGSSVFVRPPKAIEGEFGLFLVYFFGGLIVGGTLLSAIAVLPGIWWLERSGLYSMAGGVAMYAGMLVVLGTSIIVTVLPTVFILVFALRWLDIKEFLLAPREE
jgi:hypothetical protein